MPRDFFMLPTDVREVVDQYFHREELERRADLDEEEYMSTDMEAAQNSLMVATTLPHSQGITTGSRV